MNIQTVLILVSIGLFAPISCLAGGGGGDVGNQPISNPSATNLGSFGFEQSTSFYGNYSSSGQCGVQAYTDIGRNGNPNADTAWRAGVVFNSKTCVDETKLETIRMEMGKHQSQVQQNIACIQARTDLIKNGHNPDSACVLQ